MKRTDLKNRRRQPNHDSIERTSNRSGKELMSEIRALMEGAITTQVYGARALIYDEEGDWEVKKEFDIRTDKWEEANEYRGKFTKNATVKGADGVNAIEGSKATE